MPDPLRVKVKENEVMVKSEDKKEQVQVKAHARRNAKYEERIAEGNEILDIRQEVYAKLKKGRNVDSIFKMFKRKIEKFLRKYKQDISYDEGTKWKKKIVITEKAVARSVREYQGRRRENVVPEVKKT